MKPSPTLSWPSLTYEVIPGHWSSLDHQHLQERGNLFTEHPFTKCLALIRTQPHVHLYRWKHWHSERERHLPRSPQPVSGGGAGDREDGGPGGYMHPPLSETRNWCIRSSFHPPVAPQSTAGSSSPVYRWGTWAQQGLCICLGSGHWERMAPRWPTSGPPTLPPSPASHCWLFDFSGPSRGSQHGGHPEVPPRAPRDGWPLLTTTDLRQEARRGLQCCASGSEQNQTSFRTGIGGTIKGEVWTAETINARVGWGCGSVCTGVGAEEGLFNWGEGLGWSLLFAGSPNKGARKGLRDAVCPHSSTLCPGRFSHETRGPLVRAQGA